jgi:hypothetical protein
MGSGVLTDLRGGCSKERERRLEETKKWNVNSVVHGLEMSRWFTSDRPRGLIGQKVGVEGKVRKFVVEGKVAVKRNVAVEGKVGVEEKLGSRKRKVGVERKM